jgi:hypothetical protein
LISLMIKPPSRRGAARGLGSAGGLSRAICVSPFAASIFSRSAATATRRFRSSSALAAVSCCAFSLAVFSSVKRLRSASARAARSRSAFSRSTCSRAKRSRSFFSRTACSRTSRSFQLSPAPLAREPAVRAEQEWPVHARWMRGVRERLLLTKEHLMISGASEKMLEK